MNSDEQYIISPITKRPVKIGSRLFNQLVKDNLIPGFEPIRKGKATPRSESPPSPEENAISKREAEISALQLQLEQLMKPQIEKVDDSEDSEDEIIFF